MLKSKYITADEFKEYWGIDLNVQLKVDDNPSNTVDAFLARIETRIAVYLDANFYRNIDFEYPHFSDYQKKHYKLALLEQAYYVLRNSDISSDSGYDIESGVKVSRAQINELSIAPNCKDNLILCGLWCRKIKNRSRNGIGDDWLY